MALNLIGYILLLSFLSNTTFLLSSNADEASISCLKSIKSSVQDPFSHLDSWNFNVSTPICSFSGISCWHPDDNKVFSIKLSHMGLKAEFPRGLEYCTSLSTLDLSGNMLSGPIPSDIWQKLKFVTYLDLSSNQFSGAIPHEIATCKFLNVLLLDNNRLEGVIPQEIGFLNRVKVFNVTNNALIGPVPDFGKYASVAVGNNKGLCGGVLQACEENDWKYDLLNDYGIVFSFSVGWGFGFVFVVFGFFFGFPSVSMAKSMVRIGVSMIKNNGERFEGTGISHKISRLEKFVTKMKLTELSKATSNFSNDNIIGIGKTGTMYKAFLPNGCALAIKKLHSSQNCEEQQFMSELLTLGTQRHENLLPLFGFCIEKEEIFLVYKYMPNGNLYDCLHSTAKIIEWPSRMKIALGIAQGLLWLHNSCRVRIFHNNIDSHCILLDQNFVPKLSNFWEAKFLNHLECGDGSSWSLFSSFESHFQVNYEKKDVYCFGLLLVELMTGKEPSQVIHCSTNFQDIEHFRWFSSLFEVASTSLQEQGLNEMIFQLYQVARDCLKSSEEQRPSMIEVCNRLVAIKMRYR